jgi:hypothetical protein
MICKVYSVWFRTSFTRISADCAVRVEYMDRACDSFRFKKETNRVVEDAVSAFSIMEGQLVGPRSRQVMTSCIVMVHQIR